MLNVVITSTVIPDESLVEIVLLINSNVDVYFNSLVVVSYTIGLAEVVDARIGLT